MIRVKAVKPTARTKTKSAAKSATKSVTKAVKAKSKTVKGKAKPISKTVKTKDAKTKAAKAKRPSKITAKPQEPWQLRLYVTDKSSRSTTALVNLKLFCEKHLKGHYRIKVIDLLKHPKLAKGDQILAVPAVVRLLPSPVRTMIGNLSDTDRVLVGLDLRPLGI